MDVDVLQEKILSESICKSVDKFSSDFLQKLRNVLEWYFFNGCNDFVNNLEIVSGAENFTYYVNILQLIIKNDGQFIAVQFSLTDVGDYPAERGCIGNIIYYYATAEINLIDKTFVITEADGYLTSTYEEDN